MNCPYRFFIDSEAKSIKCEEKIGNTSLKIAK
jgi:hypothetical protein